MNHTKEPWLVNGESFDNEGLPESVIRGLDGRAAIAVTLDFGSNNSGMREANARRIVACVNACAGISTENLEENLPVKELARRYNVTIDQREVLLAALREILIVATGSKTKDIARSAIASVKGGA